jgi:hypothetical protein
LIHRIKSALRYFSLAAPITQWRLGRGKCSFCEGSNFISFGRSPFLTRCLSCRANIPNLATTAAIRSLKPLDDRSLKAHELSSFGATFKFMQARYAGFKFSEFFPQVAGGDYVDGVRNEDVTKRIHPARAAAVSDAFHEL